MGTLYERYVTQGTLLREYGANIGAAGVENAQRQWMVPDLGFGTFTVAGFAEAYNRDFIAEAYANILSTPELGTPGDAMSAKMQSDYVAAQERAFRSRTNGPIRCAMHAASRRAAHGLANGVFGRADSYIQDVLIAGSSAPGEGL
jgi:hypothetical protein